jgi:hypothetical protein
MGCVYILLAILLTAYIVTGALDGQSPCSFGRYIYRASAWSVAAGGGMYGLGLLDSGLIPGFNWWLVVVVIVWSFALTIFVKIKILRRK